MRNKLYRTHWVWRTYPQSSTFTVSEKCFPISWTRGSTLGGGVQEDVTFLSMLLTDCLPSPYHHWLASKGKTANFRNGCSLETLLHMLRN